MSKYSLRPLDTQLQFTDTNTCQFSFSDKYNNGIQYMYVHFHPVPILLMGVTMDESHLIHEAMNYLLI